jgi:hypothetical protein
MGTEVAFFGFVPVIVKKDGFIGTRINACLASVARFDIQNYQPVVAFYNDAQRASICARRPFAMLAKHR